MDFRKVFLTLLCLIQLVLCANLCNSCGECCNETRTTMTCSGCVPWSVSTEIKEVFINNLDFSKEINPFNSLNLSHLEKLTIIPEKDFDDFTIASMYQFTLRSETFKFLTNLKVLRFSSRRLQYLEQGVFSGLEQLEVLDLSDCIYVALSEIVNGLQGIKLPNLTTLILRNVSFLSTQGSNIDGNFFKVLQSTRLEHLDLSHTDFSMLGETDIIKFANAFPYLKTLDLEDSNSLIVSFYIALNDYGNGSTFRNLRSINANYPKLPEAANIPSYWLVMLRREAAFPHNFNFTEIRLRNCTPKSFASELYLRKQNANVSFVINFTEFFQYTWEGFHLSTLDDGSIPLEILDIGGNGFEHIDPSFTTVTKHLKYLDISFNRLNKMKLSEFETILRNMSELITFNCSRNALRIIPTGMFKHENILKVIDFSFNKIEVINFDLTFLDTLESLDLRNNNIHILDESSLKILDVFLNGKYNKDISILIDNNPLKCACETKNFATWLIDKKNSITFSYQQDNLKCFLNGDTEKPINMDENVLPQIEFLCTWPKIVAAISSVSGIVCLLVIIATAFFCRMYRARQKKKRFMQIVARHKLNNDIDKFPVFLSYCSSDADIIDTHIFTALDQRLQELLETNKRCISTGDRSFTPGFHVAEEIARCVELTDVVVACVSRNFCNSPFCKDEVIAAHHAKKPIILLFLEEVDTKILPKFIQTHFKFITRAKFSISETGEPIFTPDVDTLCRAIIMLTRHR